MHTSRHLSATVVAAFALLPLTVGARPPRTTWEDSGLGGIWDYCFTPMQRPEGLRDQGYQT